MKAVLVLNGEPPLPERLRALALDYPVYAADGGAAACLSAGVRPQWVAGDFDSFPVSALPGGWRGLQFPDQDRTDFQKLVASLPGDTDELLILGGLGKRADHFISNLLIAAELPSLWKVAFEASEQRMVRVTPECGFAESLSPGTTLSLLPLSLAGGVGTRGLKWNLQGADMGPGRQLGQSNLVAGPVDIQLSSGCLFVWIQTGC